MDTNSIFEKKNDDNFLFDNDEELSDNTELKNSDTSFSNSIGINETNNDILNSPSNSNIFNDKKEENIDDEFLNSISENIEKPISNDLENSNLNNINEELNTNDSNDKNQELFINLDENNNTISDDLIIDNIQLENEKNLNLPSDEDFSNDNLNLDTEILSDNQEKLVLNNEDNNLEKNETDILNSSNELVNDELSNSSNILQNEENITDNVEETISIDKQESDLDFMEDQNSLTNDENITDNVEETISIDKQESDLDFMEDQNSLTNDENSNEFTTGYNEEKDFKLTDDLLNDLEAVNDDFAAEINAEKQKEIAENKKKLGEEDEDENDIELKPLHEEEKLTDIKNLNLDNIEEFLQTNKNTSPSNINKVEDIKKEITEDKIVNENIEENSRFYNILETFELNNDLWNELKFSNEMKEKVENRVKMEIKSFIKDGLIPLIEKFIK